MMMMRGIYCCDIVVVAVRSLLLGSTSSSIMTVFQFISPPSSIMIPLEIMIMVMDIFTP